MCIFQALANNSPAGRFHQIDGVVLTKFDTIDTKVFRISREEEGVNGECLYFYCLFAEEQACKHGKAGSS